MDKEDISVKEIDKNIKRVFNGQSLTKPLRVLNEAYNFQERYNDAFNSKNKDRIKQEKRERKRKYYQKNKEKIRAYHREYNKRPGVKARIKKYRQKPEVKRKIIENTKKWRKNNIEQIRKRDRDKYRKEHNVPKSRWRI